MPSLPVVPTDAAEPFRPPAPLAARIAGPAGAIEARVEDPLPDGATRRVVGVVCHPHPLFGGTMQNKVVHTVARAMQEAGAATVRFNFRGGFSIFVAWVPAQASTTAALVNSRMRSS